MNMPLPVIILIISTIIGLLIAMFRNQLSTVGDAIANKDHKDRYTIVPLVLTIVALLLTIGLGAYYYYFKPLDRKTVLMVSSSVAVSLFFIFLYLMARWTILFNNMYVEEIEHLQKQIDELKQKVPPRKDAR